ncbi:MAG TPA: hypothetical protein PKD24_03920 [Pyrinomonadaceae bacterium]|nr:hypothetical protein [Pyrinomonadaceae bacterium]HMP64697.1 hypothetical protein [Pyrinomonadaceae bacterium]
MASISRRQFLSRSASALAAGALMGSPGLAQGRRDSYEFLVIGDSLVWGQGLKEEQKFYYLTKQWIKSEIFNGNGHVNLNVKAHSGSTIKLDPTERSALEMAEIPVSSKLHPEVNVSFPTVKAQLEMARREYPDPASVDLIMLSGSVPEVGVARIISPFESNDKLRRDIELYSFGHMCELLVETAHAFPNALIVVVGYYPIITRHTPMGRIVNDVLELYNWPRWTKPIINNPVKRQIWRLWRGKMIERSQIWHTGSDEALGRAVNVVNAKFGAERAVFVPTPLAEENAYGAKRTLLFKVARRGRPADPKGEIRREECGPALTELRRETNLRYRTRFCELASIGHPNVDGSAAIAEAIRVALLPRLAEIASR